MLGLRSVRFLGIPNYLPCRQETLKQSTGLTIQICHLTIKKAGDKGPEQNYRRKIKKMIKKKEAQNESDAPPVSVSFLDKLLKSEKTVDETEPATDLSDILSDMKIYIRTDDDIRRRLGMPTKSISPVEDHSVPLKPRSRVSLSFTEGKRLVPRSLETKVIAPSRGYQQCMARPLGVGGENESRRQREMTREESMRLDQERLSSTVDETIDETAYIFDPKFYQLCDLHDDSLQAIIHKNDGKETKCHEVTGWCDEDSYDKLRKRIIELIVAKAVKEVAESDR